jgi:transposase
MSTDALPLPDPDSLPDDPALLKQLVIQLLQELRNKSQKQEALEHRLDLVLRRLYGRSSEKIDPRQGTLFNTAAEEAAASDAPAESAPADDAREETPGDAPPRSKRKGHGRRPKPDHIEVREEVYDLTPAEKTALAGDGQLIYIGDEVSEHYDWDPSCLYLVRCIQKKYARRPQLPESGAAREEKNVIMAEKPPLPIAGGSAGPGLLAHVIVSKAADHLPLHRQERTTGRHGLSFPRSTTCDWWLACAELLTPLYQVLVAEVLASLVVGTDATRINIRDAHRNRQYTGFFWLYRGDERHPFSAFDFTPNQSRDGPDDFLKNYRGFLQCDASGVYDGFFLGPRMTEAGCWAHARRRYHEARDLDARIGQTALAYIGQLYQVERELRQRREREWRELDLDEIARRVAAERQSRSQPVLRDFRAWLEVEWPHLLPKNPLRLAMDYTLRHWEALSRYAQNGWLSIDNNAVERELRTIALGRKNWLFCGSDRGGHAAAVHFSLILSCQRNGVEPFAYLRDVLKQLPLLGPGATAEQLRPLLPDLHQPA